MAFYALLELVISYREEFFKYFTKKNFSFWTMDEVEKIKIVNSDPVDTLY